MNYYQTQKQMYSELEKRIKIAGADGCDKNLLIYELTIKYPISQKSILSRLSLMEQLGIIEIVGGIIQWKTN